MNAGVCTVAPWGTIFGCVGHGLLQHGLRALAGLAPGGSVIYEVCAAAAGEWKKSVDRAEERQVIEQMLAKSRDEIKAEVAQQIAELIKHATPEQAQQLADPKVAQGLELYLETIPDHMRASLRRPEDPSGNSVPANFSLREERGFASILPKRTPRFRTGDKVGNYVLTEPIGRGGFGEVWKARHVSLDSRVAAIKFCLDNDSQRNLRHEKKLIDRVQSLGRKPGIVELWDAFLDHDPPCLVYQFIAGGDLTGLMRTLKTLPAKERETRAMEVMIALASIVAPLHAMVPPIIHRDLKPANILISRNNGQDSFWVTDFGIGALAAESALGGHRQGMSRGDLMGQSLRGTHTPVYASPEQRKHAEPDPRDDVHALAVIGYQLLLGDPTEEPGADLDETLKKMGVTTSLIQFIKDCLRTKREDRLLNAGICKSRLLEMLLARTTKQRVDRLAIEKAKLEEEKRQAANEEAVRRNALAQKEALLATEKAEFARRAAKFEQDERLAASEEAERWETLIEADRQKISTKAKRSRRSKLSKPRREEAPTPFDVKSPDSNGMSNNIGAICIGIFFAVIVLIVLMRSLSKQQPPPQLATTVLKTEVIDLGKGISLELALIPAGKFMMGSPNSEAKRNKDETQHSVKISRDFFLARTEVTQAQWFAVMKYNHSETEGTHLPVQKISWEEAIDFCNRLSDMPDERKNGHKYRLPTESEWEYACRAGSIHIYSYGDVIQDLDDHAVFDQLITKKPGVVAQKKPNAFGLYDMHGNVWEWCSDWYGAYPNGFVTDPNGPKAGSLRVIRGGACMSDAIYCRSAVRLNWYPLKNSPDIGFRVAMTSSEISK